MTRRTTLTLEDIDEELLAEFESLQQPESLEREAFVQLALEHGWNVTEYRLNSEGALIRTLIRIGGETLRERTLDIGYAKLEASYTDEERDEARARRERRTHRPTRWESA